MIIGLRSQVDDLTLEAINTINLRRIFLLAITMIVAHTILVSVFYWHFVHTDYSEPGWHQGIMAAHSVMLIVIAILGLASYCLVKNEHANSPWAVIITAVTSMGYIIFGLVLTAIDQLVMPVTAIIPYLIACLGIAVTLVKSPVYSMVEYLFSLLLLYGLLFLHQDDKSILLSVSVNSIFVVIIALTLIIIRWQSTLKNIEQDEFIKKQHQELEEKNQQLAYSSQHDFLTGLYNRREFVEVAEREIARNIRSGNEACGIIIDMDNFKQINDRYGHPTGDKVLQEVAATIRSVLRGMDVAARFGGEEFAILLPETSEAAGAIVADRLRSAIEVLRIKAGNEEIRITASLGVASLEGAFNTFYNYADLALYKAKADGRNLVTTASSIPDLN